MKLFYIIGFIILMSFDTLAQISFKFASIHAMPLTYDMAWLIRILSHYWIYGAIIGYIGAFFTWMTLLKHAPVGPAFAASHLELISVTLLSIWLFNEPLTFAKVLGATLILIGVLFLAKDESKQYLSTNEVLK
ncbi:EamA family transporter [Acinetobacter sp. I-MWF]|uniref:DMT family transporter n=1 Tax=Acinetobacter TaxID=469 RepID=UPI0021C8E258|nr:EamA family transporter [Acinetobacter sp. I-MWF]MCT9978705.1 EamA family transporter [Acinetobacter sp. I-MWF]